MYHRLHLAAALLCCCTGESSVHGPPETVLAFAGGDIVLPCSFDITANDDFPTVEWSKEGLQPNVVFLYRDGCEIHEMKNPAFQYRTSFITKELKNGNISLRISNLQLSDAGKYQCMRLWKNAPRDITTVELVVGAVSEPNLSLVSAESGALTLQCEAFCWQPEPVINFLDHQGNNIPADDPKRQQEVSGCYTVTRRVTLQDPTNRVTCRVHQPELNQTRDKDIIVPVDGLSSYFLISAITVGGTGLLLLAGLVGLAFLLSKRCVKSAEVQQLPLTRQSSGQSTMSATYENHPLLQSVRVDRAVNVGNANVERLTREVADLKSKLKEKDDTIRQLQNNKSVIHQPVQPTLCASPAASTSSNPPKSGNLPQNPGPKSGTSRAKPAHRPPIRRNQSSPALFNVNLTVSSSLPSANTSKKKLAQISRSMSDSAAWPVAKGPKLQRRTSLVVQSSNNHFKFLTDVSEESELLMS